MVKKLTMFLAALLLTAVGAMAQTHGNAPKSKFIHIILEVKSPFPFHA